MNDSELIGSVLGPLFANFCYRLRLHQQAFANRNAIALFATRGGTRLRHIYNRFLEGRDWAEPCAQTDFFVSRLAVANACLLDDFHEVAPLVLNEYPDVNLEELLQAILPDEVAAQLRDRPETNLLKHQPAVPWTLAHVTEPAHPLADIVHCYFRSQADLLDTYIDQVIRKPGHETALLVDTGWSGASQHMLMRRYPDVAWYGHYFGRHNYGRPNPPQFDAIIGIAASGPPNWRQPQSAVLMQRHIIEGPCEALFQSVQGYRAADGQVIPIDGMFDRAAVLPGANDTVFAAILDYIDHLDPDTGPAELARAANRAGKRLRRILRRPSPAEVDIFAIAPRSADFGKSFAVPFVLPAEPGLGLKEKLRRVRTTLWRPGQIARDFPLVRLPIQLALATYIRFGRRIIAKLKQVRMAIRLGPIGARLHWLAQEWRRKSRSAMAFRGRSFL